MSTRFNKFPTVKMPQELKAYTDWNPICNKIVDDLKNIRKSKKIVIVEFYHGVDEEEFINEFNARLNPVEFIGAKNALLSENEISKIVFPDVTDDQIFGFMTRLNLEDFFDYKKIKQLNEKIEKVDDGDGWIEEKTGLHELEFIETRRHWFSKKVVHNTNGGVNVLCLIEGEKAIIESPNSLFDFFIINYAETVIIPAKVGAFTIRPYGKSIEKKIGTIKTYIRT